MRLSLRANAPGRPLANARAAAAFVAILAAAPAALAWEVPETGYDILRALQEKDTADGNVAGQAFALGLMEVFFADNVACFTGEKLAYRDILTAIRLYLESNPAELNDRPVVLVLKAARRSFPCKS
jgi:hypothetical protein